MVFQSFALLPWLTVQENAELGLYARGVPKNVAEEEAYQALRMVGLEGFDTAYPRELSGGMKQRVGFARAFVMKPDVIDAVNARIEVAEPQTDEQRASFSSELVAMHAEHLRITRWADLLDLREGHVDAAKRTLRSLAQDGTAPQGVRDRASALLQRLGS